MDKYDTALLGILQNEGKVAPFLDNILGFLYRRTDFFRIMKTETDNLGFPPGVAKKLLVNIFTKYEVQAKKDAEKLEEMKMSSTPKVDTETASNVATDAPERHQSKKSTDNPDSSEAASRVEPEPEDERGGEDIMEASSSKDSETESSLSNEGGRDSNKKPTEHDGNGDDTEDPEQALKRRLLQSNPLTYNGAERDDYLWSQTITECDLRVKIPAYIKKGKQVRVTIAKKHIKVAFLAEDNSWSTVVDGAMAWEVNTEESMWTITPGEFVHVNLEKREERWWECVFEDEPKINTRKIDCSRPMTDLDDEAQAKIEEMMYNQRQKELGLPQSHEQKTHDMLRKAWDAEGSPFKGQPFDPSKFNIDPNGVVNVNDV